MILWVKVETLARHDASDGDFHIKRRLERLSGEPCLTLHLSQATPDAVRRANPRAIFLSGCSTWFRTFDAREFYPFEDLVNAFPDTPTLGICGSHQLLGFQFNTGFRHLERVVDEPMRRLRPDEPQVGWWVVPETVGYYTEQGYFPIRVVKDDPLFDGLPNPCLLPESHACEIKRLPDAFDLLASTENCRVQAMKHRERPLYGVQFHPEQWTDAFPHGRTVLENFLRLAVIPS